MKQGIRDALLYISIALAIVGGAVALGIYDADHNLTSDAQMQWFAAAGLTCLVFGYVIKMNFALWRSPRALVLLVTLFLLHATFFVWLVPLALARTPDKLPLVLYTIISVLEIGAFNFIFARLRKSRRQSDPFQGPHT